MSPFEYIRNCVVTRIRPSSIHGVGTFAIKDIKKGEFMFQPWLGDSGIYTITKDEFNQLSKCQKVYIRDMFVDTTNIRLIHGMYSIINIPNCFINVPNIGEGNVDIQTGEALCDIKCNDEILGKFIYNGDKTII